MTATRSTPRISAPSGPFDDGFGRPPQPRPTRNLAGILLGVVLVVFCAAGVAAFTASIGHRRSVLVVVRPVSAGSAITDADLGEARLTPDPALHTVAAGRRASIVGRIAGVNLVPGTLLAEAQLSTGPQVDATHAVVGLALKDGQFPAGLHPLDPVSVIETSPASSQGAADPVVLVVSAEVTSTGTPPDGQTTTVSVLVPRAVAPVVANAAALGQVSLVLVSTTGSNTG